MVIAEMITSLYMRIGPAERWRPQARTTKAKEGSDREERRRLLRSSISWAATDLMQKAEILEGKRMRKEGEKEENERDFSLSYILWLWLSSVTSGAAPGSLIRGKTHSR